MPAEDQEIAFPCASVIVIMVLLKVEFTCATPDVIFLRSLRLTRVFSFAILKPSLSNGLPRQIPFLLFLTCDCFRWAFTCPRICMCSLTPDRQATTMAQTPIAAQIHQTFDVHRDFAAQITLHQVIPVDRFADLDNLSVGKLVYTAFWRNTYGFADILRILVSNPMNIGQRDKHTLMGWNVHTSDTSHVLLLR
eukprot:s1_g2144.t1